MMVVRDLSYHVVLFPTLSPVCFSSFSVVASLLLFHLFICNLVFEYIYIYIHILNYELRVDESSLKISRKYHQVIMSCVQSVLYL